MPPRGAHAGARLIVDGMNVIGSRPDGWCRDRRAAMARLVERLGRLAGERDEAVTVVFDGGPFDLQAEDAGDVEVLFARRGGPNAADDRIIELARVDADPGSLRVVTSDRDLSRRLDALGVNVEPAGPFARRLAGGARR